MIDLEKHKFFLKEVQMDVVPYKIAVQALEEVQKQVVDQIEKALEEVNKSLTHLGENVD
jgi:hypothetical protein